MILRPIDNRLVPAVGLGCMGMSEFYGKTNDVDSLATLMAAFEEGYRHFDTADFYGRGHNEELLGRFLARLGPSRAAAVVATKCGIRRAEGEKYALRFDNSPAYIQAACEASLKRLGIDAIDLFYMHRRDPGAPIEETMAALARLVHQGKIKAIGLSEVSGATLRRAHAVHPVAAIQSEYSLWTRGPEEDLLPTCAELGIAFVAYSPLGRGFLTGAIAPGQALDPSTDLRAKLPRFSGKNLARNAVLAADLRATATRLGCAPGQLALAWILRKQPHVHVIPGTKKSQYAVENFRAQDLVIPDDVMQDLETRFAPGAAAGERLPAELLRTVEA